MINNIDMYRVEFIIRPIISKYGVEYRLYKRLWCKVKYTKWFTQSCQEVKSEEKVYVPSAGGYGNTIEEIKSYIQEEYGNKGLDSVVINRI